MKYKNGYSPFSVKLNRANKTITIKYNKNILKDPGITANFDSIKKIIIPVIEDSFKNQV